MNICLVSSAPSGNDFTSSVVDELSEVGLRVVVLFLKPQSRHLWNRGNTVFYAPASHLRVFGTGHFEATYRQKLELARTHWLKPIKNQSGTTRRILLGIERRGYRLARGGGSRIAGRLEAAAALVGSMIKQPEIDPFENIPQGVTAYGVIQALDPESIPIAREGSQRSGALYFSPETAQVKAAYEQAIMHWLKG